MIRLSRSCAALAVLVISGAALAQTPEAAPNPPAASAAPMVSAAPPPAPAPEPSDWKFAFHGFAGVSFYVQDTPTFVLNGQGPLLPLTEPGTGITTGADIRQSRFNFSITGPKVLGATPKALLEIDLFGLDSPGGYGEVSAYSRVRLAYGELTWGNDILRFGQDHELILGIIPDSIGHLAFIPTYFTGQLGWREPGIGYFHTIPLDEKSKIELAAQVIKSDWENPADFGTATTQDLNVDYGQLSGYPGFEARVRYTSEHVQAFVAGHYNHVEGSNAGTLLIAPATVPNRDWDVIAGVATLKVMGGGFSFVISGYTGKNTGPLLGELLQFFVTNDVHEWGGWTQLGYEVMPELGLYVIGGIARPNESDIAAAGGGRAANSMVGAMIRYRLSGFAFGPEFYHLVAKDITASGDGAAAGGGAPDGIIDSNQFMLSAQYTF